MENFSQRNRTVTAPDAIWQNDLLSRREEAEQLILYIESVASRPLIREDKRAFTIAVDAQYGEGKTFFLKRLADQLRIQHPVAFVDAWADDLADYPLTALAATLKEALDPFLDDQNLKSQFDDFLSKTGKVASIVGKGLLRRGIGFAIGVGAVEGVEAVFSGVAEEVTGALNETSANLVEDADKAISSITAHSLMEKRVAEFEEGRAAVRAMKDSLSAIIHSLHRTEHSPPIVIVIDELDRCRPTYAIKVLEESKHLFDVSGLVFVFAIHGDQLAHSVSGAYGNAFDGRAYLNRFIDRRYRLKQTSLNQLLFKILEPYQLDQHLDWPSLIIPKERDVVLTLADLLAEYMRVYDLGARETFQLVDMLQTSTALAQGHKLQLAYFLPLLISHIKNGPGSQLIKPSKKSKYEYVLNWNRQNNSEPTTRTFSDIADDIASKLGKGWQYYHSQNEAGNRSYALQVGQRDDNANQDGIKLWSPSGYNQLLESVGRLENPKLES